MDGGDGFLKTFISSLSKRVYGDFGELQDPEKEIRFLFSQPEVGDSLLKDVKRRLGSQDDWPKKNVEVSKRNREDGNVAFQDGNFELAILLYTEAMRYSPAHETLLEGEDLAMAAANRSAAFFQLKDYESCLQDIEIAIEAGYPTNIVYKLYIRQW